MLKLDVREEIAGVVAKVIILLVAMFFFLGGLIFGFLTLATYINQRYDSLYAGYGIVAVLFLVLILVIYFMRNNRFLQRKLSELFNDYLNEK